MYSIAASSSFIHKPPNNFPFCNPNRPLFTIVRSSSSSVAQEIDKSAEKTSTEEKEGRKFPPLKAAKRVVLVRHGQSTWNAEGRIQGSSDFSVLTSKGESQAETSRQMLIDDSFDVCFSRFYSLITFFFNFPLNFCEIFAYFTKYTSHFVLIYVTLFDLDAKFKKKKGGILKFVV